MPGDVGAPPELGDGGAVKGSESAELARARRWRSWPGLGTVELARARRRRSWKGLGDGRASPGIGDGEPARAQRRRSWPEPLFLFVYWGFRARQLLMDRKQRSWKGLGNGGLARGPETAELFRGSETAELARARTWETAELFWGSEPR